MPDAEGQRESRGPDRTDRQVMEGWGAGLSGTVVRRDRVVHVEHIWGTAVTINVAGTTGRDRQALAAVDVCRDFLGRVDEVFSPYRPLSEVSLHRSGLGRPGVTTPDFAEVMAECRRIRMLTRGSFDPWSVPGGYDPSGYVKGWAAGRASGLLVAAGFADHLVNAGGDISARGDEEPGSGGGWPVGIVNPHRPTEIVEVVRLRDRAMATSGRYERGDHVTDPSTGTAAVRVDSVTVVGPDAGVADAVASAGLVDGVASMAWFGGLGSQWSLYVIAGETAHAYGSAFEDAAESREPDGGAGVPPGVS